MGIDPRKEFKVYRYEASRRGRIFVVSGPSGVGKGTVIKQVVASTAGLALSVSATTRERRPGDVDGVTYHFLTRDQFQHGIEEGIFFEHAEYKHNLYGTLKQNVQQETGRGVDLVLEIDIQGARSVKELAPDAVLIYIQPPDFDTLEARLRGRGTETDESIAERLQAAVHEQNSIEADYCGQYVLTNDDLGSCAQSLLAIVQAERHRLLCSCIRHNRGPEVYALSFAHKNVLLGVSGPIAAYKAADLCSRLGKLDADVHVILTTSAARFVGEATFRALTRNPVITDLFDEPEARRIAHIDLAQSASIVVVAPASANTIARYAAGIADDMLSTCLLATPCTTPVVIAPAMNTVMWEHPATKANVAVLAARGVRICQPDYGVLACLDEGVGKLADVCEIVRAIEMALAGKLDFSDRRVVVTAGATREPIDPVRFISNRSSGKMGFAIAAEAAERGAQVTLVAGHSTVAPPAGVSVIEAGSAAEMLAACVELFPDADVLIGAAAVADYTPANYSNTKLKKSSDAELSAIALNRTSDILAKLGEKKRPGQITVGFAAETDDLIQNARLKLSSKKLDLIVANDVTAEGAGFEGDTNIVTLAWPDGKTLALPKLSKRETAARILDAVRELW